VRIDHDQQDSVIAVSVEGDGRSSPESVSFTERLTCVSGWNVYERHSSGYADGGFVSSKVENRFAKGGDGSLIVHVSYYSERREFLFLKSTRHGEDWYRFPPLKEK